MMKKFFAVLLVLVLTAGLGACGADSASSPPPSTPIESAQPSEVFQGDGDYSEITLKFGTSSAENTLTAQSFMEWGRLLSERSGGKVNIDVFCSSVLGNNTEMTQGAQMGTIDVVVIQPGGIADMGANTMNLLTLPYLFSSYEQYYNTLTGEVGAHLLQDVTDNVNGLIGFGFLPDGGRCYFTSGKAIRNIDDIKGMKLRVQSYAVDSATATVFGFSATPTAFSELYSALQTGVVDGGENPLSGIDGNALYEVFDYLTLDNHTYNIPVLLFSEMTWNSLTADTQVLLQETWIETVDNFYVSQLHEYEAELLAKFEENGVMVVTELEDPEKWVEAVRPVWDDFGAGMEDLIEKVQELQ